VRHFLRSGSVAGRLESARFPRGIDLDCGYFEGRVRRDSRCSRYQQQITSWAETLAALTFGGSCVQGCFGWGLVRGGKRRRKTVTPPLHLESLLELDSFQD